MKVLSNQASSSLSASILYMVKCACSYNIILLLKSINIFSLDWGSRGVSSLFGNVKNIMKNYDRPTERSNSEKQINFFIQHHHLYVIDRKRNSWDD